eukprot:2785611-Prymnesium_polylepis.1
MAPEQLRQGSTYGPEIDCWAVGVILYILLSGYHPFDPEGVADDPKLTKTIEAGTYDFDEESWEHVSPAAKSVIAGLLQPDPTKRTSVSQLLATPW